MPFKSKAQMKFMYANHPDIAKRWEDKYGVSKGMPMHVKKTKKVVKKMSKGGKAYLKRVASNTIFKGTKKKRSKKA